VGTGCVQPVGTGDTDHRSNDRLNRNIKQYCPCRVNRFLFRQALRVREAPALVMLALAPQNNTEGAAATDRMDGRGWRQPRQSAQALGRFVRVVNPIYIYMVGIDIDLDIDI